MLVLWTKPSGLYRYRRGARVTQSRLQRRKSTYPNFQACLPRKGVPPGHGTKSSILYLHSPTVRHKHIVRLSEDPLI